jgi:actin
MKQNEERKLLIIIDNGSGFIKVAFSGERLPKTVISFYIGYQNYASGRVGIDKKQYFVGAEAEAIKGVLNINNPIENGVVNNWDDIENIWKYIFENELKVNPIEYNIMLTETPMNPKENREKMTQIMFETFNVLGLYIAIEPVLSLYSVGKFSGIVSDLGEHISYFAPIFYGCILPHAIIKLNFAGNNLTEYMQKLLEENGQKFSTIAEKEIIKTIKEKSCYVALNYEEEKESVEKFEFELPDGTKININEQKKKCPETLFKPKMIGKEEKDIEEVCFDSIQKCNINIRKELFNSIFL